MMRVVARQEDICWGVVAASCQWSESFAITGIVSKDNALPFGLLRQLPDWADQAPDVQELRVLEAITRRSRRTELEMGWRSGCTHPSCTAGADRA